ncbi:hypothetical protein EV426DRAFT_699006, partial [Tirmania nivea]
MPGEEGTPGEGVPGERILGEETLREAVVKAVVAAAAVEVVAAEAIAAAKETMVEVVEAVEAVEAYLLGMLSIQSQELEASGANIYLEYEEGNPQVLATTGIEMPLVDDNEEDDGDEKV